MPRSCLTDFENSDVAQHGGDNILRTYAVELELVRKPAFLYESLPQFRFPRDLYDWFRPLEREPSEFFYAALLESIGFRVCT
jgi:hypothetical protein